MSSPAMELLFSLGSKKLWSGSGNFVSGECRGYGVHGDRFYIDCHKERFTISVPGDARDRDNYQPCNMAMVQWMNRCDKDARLEQSGRYWDLRDPGDLPALLATFRAAGATVTSRRIEMSDPDLATRAMAAIRYERGSRLTLSLRWHSHGQYPNPTLNYLSLFVTPSVPGNAPAGTKATGEMWTIKSSSTDLEATEYCTWMTLAKAVAGAHQLTLEPSRGGHQLHLPRRHVRDLLVDVVAHTPWPLRDSRVTLSAHR